MVWLDPGNILINSWQSKSVLVVIYLEVGVSSTTNMQFPVSAESTPVSISICTLYCPSSEELPFYV